MAALRFTASSNNSFVASWLRCRLAWMAIYWVVFFEATLAICYGSSGYGVPFLFDWALTAERVVFGVCHRGSCAVTTNWCQSRQSIWTLCSEVQAATVAAEIG